MKMFKNKVGVRQAPFRDLNFIEYTKAIHRIYRFSLFAKYYLLGYFLKLILNHQNLLTTASLCHIQNVAVRNSIMKKIPNGY